MLTAFCLRRLRASDPSLERDELHAVRITSVICWLTIPPLLCFVAAYLGVKGVYFRTMAISAPALYLALGWFIHRIRPFALQAICIACVLACSVGNYRHYYFVHHKENWRGAAEFVAKDYRGEPIVVMTGGASVPFNYYFRADHRIVEWTQFISEPVTESRVWVIHALTNIPLKQVARDLAARGYDVQRREDFPGIQARLYSRR